MPYTKNIMSKSYSKIRHIQEANVLLENRLMGEKSKQYLNEQVGQCKPIVINLPVDSQGNVNGNGYAQFTLSGLGNKASTEYFGTVQSMRIGGVDISNVFTGQKLVGETITGSILLKNNHELISMLQNLKGKGKQSIAGNGQYLVYPIRKVDPNNPASKGGAEMNFMCELTVGTYIPTTI